MWNTMKEFLEMELKETNILLSDCNERIWKEIGELSIWMEDTRRSIVAFEAVLRHSSVSTKALKQLGKVFQKIKKYENAIFYYKKCLLIDPSDIEVKKNLLICYMIESKQAEGLVLIETDPITQEETNKSSFLFVVGLFYERCGNYEKAECFYVLAISKQMNYEKLTETYIRLAVLCMRKRKEDFSICLLKHALKLDDVLYDKRKIMFEIVQALVLKGKYKKALSTLEKIKKETSKKYRLYGLIYSLMENDNNIEDPLSLAHKFLDMSISLDSGDALTFYYKANCYLKEGITDKAYSFYKKAMGLDPYNPALWVGIAIFYYKTEKYHDALLSYSQALQIWPHEPIIWYNIGVLYESCSTQFSDAKDAYKRSIELNENNEDSKQRLEYLEKNEDNKKRSKESIPQSKEIDPVLFCRRNLDYYLNKTKES